MALGKAVVNILANLKPLKRGLLNAKALVSKMVSNISRTSFNILKTGLRKIISLAKLAAVAILGIGVASAKTASDAAETQNLYEVAFGKMKDSADDWVNDYVQKTNIWDKSVKKTLGTFFLMISGMGLAKDESFEMAKGLTALTTDLASLRNISLDEAFTKLSAGLVGESEPLKRLGIIVNESTIQLLAQKDANILARIATEKATPKMKLYGGVMVDMAKKSKTATIVLTEQEKVQLRYRDILNKTNRDQGDFVNTADETANVLKIIQEQTMRTAETIGTTFITEITTAGQKLRDWLIENQEQIKDWAIVIKDNVMAAIEVIRELFTLAKGGEWEKVFTRLGEIFKNVLKGIGEALKTILPKAKEIGLAMFEGFKEGLSGTTLGSFLDVAGTAARGVGKAVDVAVGAPARSLGRAKAFEIASQGATTSLTPGGQSRIEQARSSGVIDQQGNLNLQMLQELQKLNKQVQRQNEEF
jgi:hypothetical protein